jgi:hypothetical protein
MISKALTYIKANLWAQAALTILVTAIVWVAIVWIVASSETSVPKAEEYNRQSANAHNTSVLAESNANVIAERVKQAEANRQGAIRNARTANETLNQSKQNLNKRKAEYENNRKKGIVANANNLDARERQLESDLKSLYPQN